MPRASEWRTGTEVTEVAAVTDDRDRLYFQFQKEIYNSDLDTGHEWPGGQERAHYREFGGNNLWIINSYRRPAYSHLCSLDILTQPFVRCDFTLTPCVCWVFTQCPVNFVATLSEMVKAIYHDVYEALKITPSAFQVL